MYRYLSVPNTTAARSQCNQRIVEEYRLGWEVVVGLMKFWVM